MRKYPLSPDRMTRNISPTEAGRRAPENKGRLALLEARLGAGDEQGLIEALYDAALGRRSWDEVNTGFRSHIGGETLMLSVQHLRSGAVDVLGWVGMSPESLQAYPQFAPHDV